MRYRSVCWINNLPTNILIMIYIGIDPGKDGGIAYINTLTGEVGKTGIPKIGDEVDLNKYCDYLRALTKGSHHVILENVHSIFGASAKSNFSFGKNNGHIEGFLVALGAKYTLVTPKKWQAEMWEGVPIVKINTGKKTTKGNIKYKNDTKATSLKAVKRLFPQIDLRKTTRSTKPHDGIVDALLLAEYGKRNF